MADIQYGVVLTGKDQSLSSTVKSAREETQKLGEAVKLTSRQEKELAGEFDNLLKRIDPAYRAQKQFSEGSDILKRGLDAGKISQQQYANGISLLEKESAKAAQTVGVDMVGAFNRLGLVALATGVLTQIPRQIIASSIEAEQASARVEATLKATGNTANITRKEIDDLANSLALSTQFDDESLLNAQAEFLKFGNIQDKVFTRGIKLSTDLAAFMGTDVANAAQLVGYALASPAEASGRLERQIGKLTDSQEKSLEKFIKQNDLIGAQNLLLTILEGKLGGTAEKMNNGFTKATADSAKAWDDLMEAMGRSEKVSSSVEALFGGITSTLNGMKNVVEDGDWVDKLLLVMGLKPTVDYLAKGSKRQAVTGGNSVPGAAAISGGNVMPLTAGAQIQYESGKETGGGYGTNVNEKNNKRLQEDKRAADLARQQRQEMARSAAEDNAKLIRTFQDAVEPAQTLSEKLQKQLNTYTAMDPALRKYLQGLSDQVKANEQAAAAQEFSLEFDERLRDSDARSLEMEEQLAAAEVDRIATLQSEAQALAELLDPQLKIFEQQDRYFQMLSEGMITQDQYDAALEKLGDTSKKAGSFAKDLGDSFKSSAEQAIRHWEGFGNFFSSLMEDLEARIARRTIIDPIFNGVDNWLSQNTGDIGGLIGGMFGGGRANGGEVSRGMFYRVNENSPELLNVDGENYLMMGGKSGHVIPSRGALASGTVNAASQQAASTGNVRVEIVNNGTPQQVQMAEPSFDAEGMIVKVFLSDIKRNGPITRNLGQTFNLARG